MIVRGKFVSLPNKKIMLCRKDIKYNCLKINRCVPYGMMSYNRLIKEGNELVTNCNQLKLVSPKDLGKKIEKSKQECRNYGFKYADY